MSKTTNSTKKVNNNNSKYAGGAYNSKKPISGPGIWITCVRHMEKRCVPEMYNLLEDVADRLYPAERLAELELLRPIKQVYVPAVDSTTTDDNAMETEGADTEGVEEVMEVEEEPVEEPVEEEEYVDESIEATIARELAELRSAKPTRSGWTSNSKGGGGRDSKAGGGQSGGPKQPKVKVVRQRFESLDTKTECVVFIAFKYPYDPVEITERIVMDLQETGISRTKYTNRLEPVIESCSSLAVDSINSISLNMIEKVFSKWAIENNKTHVTYQIDPQVRLHTGTLNRQVLVELLGTACRSLSLPPLPTSLTPNRPLITTAGNLTAPDLVLVPVVQKNIFGLSIVQGKLWSGPMGRKFNLDAIGKEFRDRRERERSAGGGEENLSRVGELLESKREDGRMEENVAMRY